MSLYDALSSSNMKQVESIIEKCADVSYALVRVYIDPNT